ncbi:MULTISPECIES: hypothetical protein [unclassified Streptomyces]|nr:hypothetical protein [Streptomyces sp. CB02959]
MTSGGRPAIRHRRERMAELPGAGGGTVHDAARSRRTDRIRVARGTAAAR